MLFLTYKPLDTSKQSTFPPLILQITPSLLTETVLQFKHKVHDHFKQYLSPFINVQHLKLINHECLSMINQFPMYMYVNPKQHMQQVYCTTQPKKDQADQEWEFKRNCLVLKSDRKFAQGEMIEAISKKQLDKLDRKVQELQKLNGDGDGDLNVIIEGKIIKPIQTQTWSQFIQHNWQDFVRSNECVYFKVY